MSKRRNRKNTQNVQQDILERARQQIALEQAGSGTAAEDTLEDKEVIAVQPTSAPAQPPRSRPRRREGIQPARLGQKQVDLNDPQTVQKMLANPTKVVTEEQLRQEYGYVLADLRSMGLLAAALVVALIMMAQWL
jgi:hypothetical protein